MEVALEGVRLERDGRVVLDLPSLVVRGGRTTAILGPNGSGKTTLLRAIGGLERPRDGRVLFGGSEVRPRYSIAFLFQEQVFLRQSVRDNLELGLRLRRLHKEERRVRIEEAARLLGIAHLLDRRADRVSGGEGRRVSLARVLCLRAPLVLLDEPLGGLDERTYARLLDELPELLGAFDATTLLVTHNRHEALRLAQDLVVLVDGKVHAAGNKREVATNPRVVQVAEVLGYSVLPVDSRQVAVPAGALKLGPGRLQFEAIVEDVLDLVESRTLIGRIGGMRVQAALHPEQEMPARGERVILYADRFYELT